MNFIDACIKRPVTIFMLIIIIVVFGFVSVTNIEQSLLPKITMPYVMIMTNYAGAGPQDVEKLVTKPIEEAVSTVPNFKKVTSTSSAGMSIVNVELTSEADIKYSSMKIREKVDMFKSLLPSDVSNPMIMELDTSNMPIIAVAVSGGKSKEELNRLATNVFQKKLERVPGVAQVYMEGNEKDEIRISVAKEKAAGYGITFNQIKGALASQNLTLPGGKISEGNNELFIRTYADILSIDEVKKIVITTMKGPVYLEDVALIEKLKQENPYGIKIDKSDAVSIALFKQPDASTVKVSKAVKQVLDDIKKENNEVNYIFVFDQAEYIQKSLGSIYNSGLIGGFLAILVLLLFLANIRSTLIVGIAIPISIISTFMLMYFNNISFNVMSAAGLVLGIGMLVDNSVVVLENIYRYMELGYNRREAASKGTREVASAVIASTLTTIAVFAPLAFIKGNVTVSMFKEVGFTIAFSLLSSLLIALTLVPVMASKWMNLNKIKVLRTNRIENFGKSFINKYLSVLNWSLGHKKSIIFILLGAFVLSVVGMTLIGAELFPKSDTANVKISFEMPKGTLLTKTEQTGKDILAISTEALKSYSNPLNVLQVYGSGGNGMSSTADSSLGEITFKFVDAEKRKYNTDQLCEVMRKALQNLPGPKITIASTDMSSSMFGGGTGSAVSINIYGDDFSVLKDLSVKTQNILKNVQGVRNISSTIDQSSPELRITMDRLKASSYGVTASDIANTVQTAIMGSRATSIKIDGDDIDVKIRYHEDYRGTIDDVKTILVSPSSPMGVGGSQAVPLYEVAKIEMSTGPLNIIREDLQRCVTITADVFGRTMGDVNKDIETNTKQMIMPNDYKMSFGGNSKEMAEAMGALVLMLLLAIMLIYMIMASQFESLIHPFIIMFSVPLAIIGVTISLVLFRMPFSVPVFVGIITLAGTVVNNAIILVDYVNTLRREEPELNLKDVLLKAGKTRLRPIFITTITTVLGLVPMAFSNAQGVQTMKPFAVAVMGGLTFSTILTLVLIPCLYVIMENTKVKIYNKIHRIKPEDTINV